jgi:hypothetical protein
MKRTILCFGVIALLVFSFASCKKKTGEPATGETARGADIRVFDDGFAAFRESIRFVSLTPSKEKAAEAAARAEEAFGEAQKTWPEEPPEEFEGDNDWPNRISTLTKIMGDLRNQVSADNFTDAEASIREAQKLILELHEKNNVNTAGDEAVRLLVIADEMKLALNEKRFNDMKHIMPNMREAQKNFFGSAIPPAARGRENEFDDAKDKVYDGVEKFADAAEPELHAVALDELIQNATVFYVEFS